MQILTDDDGMQVADAISHVSSASKKPSALSKGLLAEMLERLNGSDETWLDGMKEIAQSRGYRLQVQPLGVLRFLSANI